MKGIIIGGGIGGLTLGIALQQNGLDFEIYEAAPAIRPVGAGIMLGTNAMLVLRELGLEKAVESAGQKVRNALICDRSYKRIGGVPLQKVEAKYGAGSVLIHRGALQKVLLDHLEPNRFKLGFEAISADEISGEVLFGNGQKKNADYLIGADGIHSVMRKSIFPEIKKRYSGQTCWRGVLPFELSGALQKSATEIWDPSGRFGISDLGAGQVYWYAVLESPEGGKDNPDSIKQDLLTRFSRLKEPVLQLIKETPEKAIIRSDLHDLPPSKPWHKGKIALMGDAIHATTPNMGQGGGQAIEDAPVLASCLAHFTDPTAAFDKYEKFRYGKAAFVTRQSARIGRVAHVKNPAAAQVRNLLMRSVPSALMLRQMHKINLVKKVTF